MAEMPSTWSQDQDKLITHGKEGAKKMNTQTNIEMTDATFATLLEYLQLVKAYNRSALSRHTFNSSEAIHEAMMAREMILMDAGYTQEQLDQVMKAVR